MSHDIADASPGPVDDEILERLQARHEARTRVGGSILLPNELIGCREITCKCAGSDCGREFSIVAWFNRPDRPMAPAPKWCPACATKREAVKVAEPLLEKGSLDERARSPGEVDILSAVEHAGGNPHQFGGQTLDGFPAGPGQQKALTSAVEWREAVLASRDKYEKVRGLYLVGPTGTGKTQLLHCVLRDLIEAGMRPGKDVIFDDSLSLIERIQGTYGSNESTWALLEARIAARVWMLDEFLAEKATDDVVRKLTLIFNRREGKPTAVTSNHHPSSVADKHPEYYRLLSRFGTANFRIVSVAGADMRFTSAAWSRAFTSSAGTVGEDLTASDLLSDGRGKM